LGRYSREVGANEELVSLIINSLEDWDNKMQIECAQSFIAPLRAKVRDSTCLIPADFEWRQQAAPFENDDADCD
jgi:hypothetical protein